MYCADSTRCARYKRIRLEAVEEFERLGPSSTWARYEEWLVEKREYELQHKREKAAETRPPAPPTEGKCAHCGNPWSRIPGTKGRKKYCSDSCKQKAFAVKKPKAMEAGHCLVCGTSWTRRKAGVKKLYCSRRCKEKKC